ncbi:MAG: hypothetical protein WB507_04505 [Solirubrobacterales bacterium]
MSRRASEFQLKTPVAESYGSCHRAVERLDWKIAESEPQRLLAKIGFGVLSNPAKIEILLKDENGTTVVRLEGKIAQFGPIATRKLENYLNVLKEAIQLEAAQPPARP